MMNILWLFGGFVSLVFWFWVLGFVYVLER